MYIYGRHINLLHHLNVFKHVCTVMYTIDVIVFRRHGGLGIVGRIIDQWTTIDLQPRHLPFDRRKTKGRRSRSRRLLAGGDGGRGQSLQCNGHYIIHADSIPP